MTVGQDVSFARRAQASAGEDRRRRSLWHVLTAPASSIFGEERRRTAQLLSSLLMLLAVAVFLTTVIVLPILAGPDFVALQDFTFVAGLGVSVGLAVAYAVSRTKAFRTAAFMAVGVLYVVILGVAIADPGYISADIVLIGLVLVVLLGSLALSLSETIILSIVCIAGVVLLPTLDSSFGLVSLLPVLLIVGIMSALIVIGAVVRQRDVVEVTRRSFQLRATAEVNEVMAAAHEFEGLLVKVVNSIAKSFDFYHVQIFLLDDFQNTAELRASTGTVGASLMERGHQLPVGSLSVIGQVTAFDEPVIATDVSMDPIHRHNELLPETRSELALPLRVGDVLIGALDVQSTEVNAFSAGDVETLQFLANQIAVTLENSLLLEEVQQRMVDNERVLEEAQANLQRAETLNRLLTRQGWQDYIGSRGASGTLGYTLQGGDIETATGWTPVMRRAFGEERLVAEDGAYGGESNTIALPLQVRSEVIGVLEVERRGERGWSDEDVLMAESLVERLSAALDSARLFEQAQSLAQREQLVNEITQSVQQAGSVDDVLQAALVELGQVLGASRGVVQLKATRSEGGQPSASPNAAQSSDDEFVTEEN